MAFMNGDVLFHMSHLDGLTRHVEHNRRTIAYISTKESLSRAYFLLRRSQIIFTNNCQRVL